MTRPSSRACPGGPRVFIACLLAYLTLTGPVAPAAASGKVVGARAARPGGVAASSAPRGVSRAAATEPAVAPAPPAAPATTVTATKTDNVPNATALNPGDEISYEVTAGAAGGAAANVQFSDPIDANTTLVPGSVTMSPLARADSYGTPKETALNVNAAAGLLANDSGLPAPAAAGVGGCADTAAPFTGCATTGGGTVTLNVDGSFNYTPGPGFEGSDTFTYTATNSNTPDDTATVTVVVDAAPTVTATTPTNGATNVANNADISVTFSEAVTATGTWFTISGASSGSHTAAVTGGPTSLTLNPDADFADGEVVTVTVVAAQVTDNDGGDPPDQMTSNVVFSFTTDNAPAVTTTTPAAGATGVSAGTNITVNFSESVNATTGSFKIECPVGPANAQPYTLGPSPAASFTLNPNSNLPAGVICTVTVVAAHITDQDSGDPPDTMAADHVFTFSIPPDAVDDSHAATGNVPFNAGTRLLANDVGPDLAVSAIPGCADVSAPFDCNTARGGQVSVAADGTYSYNPPAGYEGADSVTYTVANAAGSDTATINLSVAGMLWFVDDSAPTCTANTVAGNCGRLTNPFSSLAAFESFNGNAAPANNGNVIAPQAGEHVFIYSGSYTGPLTLENNQRVVGQGATASLSFITGVTPVADSVALPATGGTNPTITSSAASTNGINLAQGNTLRGLTIGNTTGAKISGNNFGTLTAGNSTSPDLLLNGTGQALSLTNGTFAATSAFSGVTTTSSAAQGISLSSVAGTVNFGNTSVGGSSGTGVALGSVSAALTFADLDIAPNSGQRGLHATGQTGALTTTSGTIGTANGVAVEIAGPASNNRAPLNIQLTAVNASGGPNGIVLTNTNATASPGGFRVNGNGGACTSADQTCTGGTIQNVSADGVRLSNASNVSLSRMHIKNTSSAAGAVCTALDNSDCSAGVDMVNASNLTLSNLIVRDSAQMGINGRNVNGLTVTDSEVLSPGDGDNEFGMLYTELAGEALFEDVLVDQAEDTGVWMRNTSGTLNMTIRRATISNTGVNPVINVGEHGAVIEIDGTALATILIEDSEFHHLDRGAIEAQAEGTGAGSTLHLTVRNNNLHDNGSFGVEALANYTSTLNVNVAGNIIHNWVTNGVNILGAVNSNVNARVTGNTLTNPRADDVANGIRVVQEEDSDMTTLVQGNSVSGQSFTGIIGFSRLGDLNTSAGTGAAYGTHHLTVRGNNISAPTAVNGGYGIDLQSQNEENEMCLDVGFSGSPANNVSAGTGAGVTGTRVRKNDTSSGGGTSPVVFRIEGMALGAQSLATTETHVETYNPSSTAFANTTPAGGTFDGVAANTCRDAGSTPLPSNAAVLTSDVSNAPATPTGRTATARRKVRIMTGSEPAADPAAPVAAPAAPEPAAPAPARVWNDMPVIITRTPRTGAVAGEKSGEEEEDEAGGEEGSPKQKADEQGVPDPAATDAQPAEPKGRVKRIETYRPKVKNERARPEKTGLPENRKISYLGPLGSAPARAPRFARASYEAGDAVARRAPAREAAKAVPARAAAQPFAGETVNVSIGDMPAGKSVKIRFKAKVNDPLPGGVTQVANQGTVSYTGGAVQTDDPDTGTVNDATVTLVSNSVDVSVNDAKVAEPASPDTVAMTFTVSLSRPVPAGGTVGVNFDTADGGANPATGGTCGSGGDYTPSSGTVSFAAGEQVKTINVSVCSDEVADDGETLLINLSNATGGAAIADGQAEGTVTGNTPGGLLLSELRTSGPGGAGDDFVEVYNNSDSPHAVAAADSSGGYGLFKMGAGCDSTPVLVGTIPNGTVIPARGHYLLVGGQYSLKDYGGTDGAKGDQPLSADLGSDGNVGLFSTSDVTKVSTANRLDAVGFGLNAGNACDLLREGSTLPAQSGSAKEHTFFRKLCDFLPGVGCATPGFPKDTNSNASDFLYADTAPDMSGAQRLGAPGPENMAAPVRRDTSGVGLLLLDPSKAAAAAPNRARDFTADLANNSTFGTLTVRRRVVNNTGGPVTRLRFRLVEVTTFPAPAGMADLRARTGVNEVSVGPVDDQATCTAAGVGTAPCGVGVQATSVEAQPAQPNGGGMNSTLSAGTVTLATPLANGTGLNVNFLLGVQQTGKFRFLLVVEALP